MKTYFILLALCLVTLLTFGQSDYQTISVYSSSIQGISFPLKKNMTLQDAVRKNKLITTNDHTMETREVFMCFKDSLGYTLVTTYGPNGVINSEKVIYFRVLLIDVRRMPNEMIIVIGWKEKEAIIDAICVMDYFEDADLYQFVMLVPDKKNKQWSGISFLNADIDFNINLDSTPKKTEM